VLEIELETFVLAHVMLETGGGTPPPSDTDEKRKCARSRARLPVRGEVVLAAQHVIIDTGHVRDGRVQSRRTFDSAAFAHQPIITAPMRATGVKRAWI
jgi:hypothetical protein